MPPGARTADELVATSIEHLNRGESSLAVSAARQAVIVEPDHCKALSTLGYALHAQGKHRESEQVYLRMAELDPAESMHWMNVGTERRNDERIDEALYAFARAAALGANTADFFYNVSLAHIARDDYESAYSLLERALELAPLDAEIRYRYAFCCYETLRTEQALAALYEWEQIGFAVPELAASAGHLMMKLGDIERAEPAVRAAVRMGPGDPRARLTLIQLLERTNRLDEARQLLDHLKTECPLEMSTEIYAMEAQLAQRESDHQKAAVLFKSLADACTDAHLRHFHQYPLAKSLDALERYEEAFDTLSAAHASQLDYLKLASPLALRRGLPLAIAEQLCRPEDIAAWDHSGAPATSQSPIFIVGYPRSGTTLLELVLDAHPLSKSIDEQPFLQNALDDTVAEEICYPAELAQLTGEQLTRIRNAYWDRVKTRLQTDKYARIIDKNPLNILRLPLIKRLFPHAKILLAIRHPCDVILSCFMQHFRAPDFALLCLNIPTITHAYRKTFDFWFSQQALLQADVFELRYETFVNDFAAQTRRVCEFLELPWSEAMLEPASRANEKRYISTPSYSQVVKPINASAVGRWTNYRRHFTANLPVLEPYLQRWSYPV